MLLNKKESILIIALSNQLNINFSNKVDYIKDQLESLELNVIISKYIYGENESKNIKNRATEFNSFLNNNEVCGIFDISGGDLANEIIPYINIDSLKNYSGFYAGYSDLSVIISIFLKYNKKTVYYNIKTLLYNKKISKDNFYKTFMCNAKNSDLLSYTNYYKKLGKSKLIGGNIRCILKLAGTNLFLDPSGSIVFFESCSGDIKQIRSYLAQYEQLDFFKSCKGILLGQFTEISRKNEYDYLLDVFYEIAIKYDIPLSYTNEVGHSQDSKALLLNKI